MESRGIHFMGGIVLFCLFLKIDLSEKGGRGRERIPSGLPTEPAEHAPISEP